MGFAASIPLDDLPKRLNELDKNKIIVAACPHQNRDGFAMAYLRTTAFQSKYLVDGLVGLAEYLRVDRALDFSHLSMPDDYGSNPLRYLCCVGCGTASVVRLGGLWIDGFAAATRYFEKIRLFRTLFI